MRTGICEICGSEFQMAARGRRRKYCYDGCDHLKEHLKWASTRLGTIARRGMTPERVKHWRAEFRSMSNLLNIAKAGGGTRRENARFNALDRLDEVQWRIDNPPGNYNFPCPTCGVYMAALDFPKGGRKRAYCSDDCREMAKLSGWLQNDILALIDRIEPEQARALRGRIMGASNALNVAVPIPQELLP